MRIETTEYFFFHLVRVYRKGQYLKTFFNRQHALDYLQALDKYYGQ